MARLRAVNDFVLFILAGFGAMLLLLRLLEQSLIPNFLTPEWLWKFLQLYTTPPPFPQLRQMVNEYFSYNSVATHLYVAASETLRYQGLYLLSLWAAKKCTHRPFSLLIVCFGFTSSVVIFAFIHYEIALALVGGIIFNLLVTRYKNLPFLFPLFPPFFLHLLWNLLPPPIPTFF